MYPFSPDVSGWFSLLVLVIFIYLVVAQVQFAVLSSHSAGHGVVARTPQQSQLALFVRNTVFLFLL